MPPSSLISVHTVGCAWRLLMRYVNTLPKTPCGVSLRAVTYLPTHHPSRWNRIISPLCGAQGGSRGKINATSNRALSDTAISRLARGKRESPRREVWKFKRRETWRRPLGFQDRPDTLLSVSERGI